MFNYLNVNIVKKKKVFNCFYYPLYISFFISLLVLNNFLFHRQFNKKKCNIVLQYIFKIIQILQILFLFFLLLSVKIVLKFL